MIYKVLQMSFYHIRSHLGPGKDITTYDKIDNLLVVYIFNP